MNFHPEEIMMLVLLVGVFCFLGLIVFLKHKKDQLRHSERLAALDKGVALTFETAPKRPDTPRVYLLRGLLWLFVGVGIALTLGGIAVSTHHPPSMESRLSHAQSLKQSGGTEEQVKQLMREMDQENDGVPFGLAALGLIPMGVGLAYLIFYRKETEAAKSEVA
jgi:hypothetical protein